MGKKWCEGRVGGRTCTESRTGRREAPLLLRGPARGGLNSPEGPGDARADPEGDRAGVSCDSVLGSRVQTVGREMTRKQSAI